MVTVPTHLQAQFLALVNEIQSTLLINECKCFLLNASTATDVISLVLRHPMRGTGNLYVTFEMALVSRRYTEKRILKFVVAS